MMYFVQLHELGRPVLSNFIKPGLIILFGSCNPTSYDFWSQVQNFWQSKIQNIFNLSKKYQSGLDKSDMYVCEILKSHKFY